MTITDIVNKIYFLTKTNINSFPASTMLIAINNAYERVASLVLTSDGRWQFDDNNYTDISVATTALVSGQKQYTLSTAHLKILKVRIKDTAGNWTALKNIDVQDENYESIINSTTTGIPTHVDASGSGVVLGVTPNYSQDASLELTFQRGPAIFTSAEVTTGTKLPGFNSLYHDLIPLWVSYDYAIANGLKNANQLMVEIQRKESILQKDQALRNKSEKPGLRIRQENNR